MERLSPEQQELGLDNAARLVPAIRRSLEEVRLQIGRPHFELWPLLGAARCLRLLEAMLVLRDANLPDVLGVLARTHYETWAAASYVSHAGQRAVDELAADFMHDFTGLTNYLGIPLPEHTPHVLKNANPKKLNTWNLVNRLEECLPPDHALKDYAVPAYKHLFAGESLFSTHGRVGSFQRHLARGEGETLVIRSAVAPDAAQLDHIWEAAARTSALAIDALHAVGVNVDELADTANSIGVPAYPER